MDFNHFFIAGINYKKTDASSRGQFAIQPDQYTSLLQKAALQGIQEVFVLSTCNRTEIYGMAQHAGELVQLLCNETTATMESFEELCYIKQGKAAAEHLFAVAAGLDSQILGDYEIVGQLKQAAKFSKDQGCIGTYLDRLLNIVLQSSKAIRTNTALSGGTVSVSFAAIQFLKDHVADISEKEILVLGTGKIGRNTCKNLVDYLGTTNITLINRTEARAEELAKELKLRHASYSYMDAAVAKADIVIVATNAEQPVITTAQLQHSNPKILIDLSIPNNVAPSAKSLAHITLVNVDDLSKINDATLQKRLAEVPKAKAIIAEHMEEFREWYNMRKNVPLIKAVKQKLMDMQQNGEPGLVEDEAIQKVINNMALKMRKQPNPGCDYIGAITDYITGRVN
ncbi:glutamyl-tRNA reductase [Deminuibacter soli]|uniref:Glutamyl-tRNA reductase n=1 Tax=Deminuibacter soli TaxID=2291815 RepID=A0A3E1NP70_9BACT|nr:glutamyl-tRNA reductase [Deminuibacter soli]RFM29731.1 glutamyl-tRNA reductase [Deminuibacter soli]